MNFCWLYSGLLLLLSHHTLPVSSTRPLLIDTDVDVDDLTAIAYLLNEPSVSIKALTVVSTGWVDQVPGGTNLRRLTQFFGCPKIPVGVGSDVGFTSTTDDHSAWLLPNPAFKTAVNNVFTFQSNTTNCSAPYLAPNPKGHSPLDAEELITHTLKTSDEPVDLLMLGPFTNLARAIKADPSIIDSIGTVYISGGDLNTWGVPDTLEQELQGPRFPYTAITKGATWNVWLDPYAVHYVISSLSYWPKPPKVVAITEQGQNTLPMGPDPFESADLSSHSERFKFVHDFIHSFAQCYGVGQDISQFKWWDQSAALLMVDVMNGNHSDVCTEWHTTTISMNLNNGPKFGQMFEYEDGIQMDMCISMNKTAFLTSFWGQIESDKRDECPVDNMWNIMLYPNVRPGPIQDWSLLILPGGLGELVPLGYEGLIVLFFAMVACCSLVVLITGPILFWVFLRMRSRAQSADKSQHSYMLLH